MRRVVTGHGEDGKSVFIVDGEPPRVARMMTGAETAQLWATEGAPQIPAGGGDPSTEHVSFLPGVGGTRFGIVCLPTQEELRRPFQEGVSPDTIRQEALEKVPGLAEAMEQDNPGMHTTDSIDYVAVISGELWLELDDGAEVRLEAGDCVVQNGTRHAWRNRGSEPCVLVYTLIGAKRN